MAPTSPSQDPPSRHSTQRRLVFAVAAIAVIASVASLSARPSVETSTGNDRQEVALSASPDKPEADEPVLDEVEAVLLSLQKSAEPSTTSFAETRELDRLIEVFISRTAERGQSLEYRRLGELLLQRAELAADLTDYRASLDAFTEAVELSPTPANLVGQGRAALGVHDFDTAARAAEAVRSLDPDDLDGLLLAADVAFALEDPDAVVGPLELLIQEVGDDPAVLVRQAELATLAGEADAVPTATELAGQALTEAEERGLEGDELAYYQTYAGRVAFDRGEYPEAARLLELSLANAPDDHGALGELARVRAATGDLDEAIALLDQANDLVPEPDHVVLVGDLRARVGDREGATADYEWAVGLATLDADHARAWGHSVIQEFSNDPDLPATDQAAQRRWAEAMVTGASMLEARIGEALADQLAESSMGLGSN